MPKETTYGSQQPYGEDSPAESVVQVLWGRETQHVQLVSKCINRSTGDDMGPPDERTPREMYFTDGFYVTLDRAGINKLIRDLRRARDQAYGKDE